MKHSVFISHSIKDKAIADEVCDFLERNAISCWIAPRDVLPGKNYGSAIVDAIDECAVFVLILTHESNKSGSVAREVERAASANVIIIPFRLEQVQPSKNLAFFVNASHFLDGLTKPLEKHLLELLKAIQNWQGTEVLSQERPPSVLSHEHPSSVLSQERPPSVLSHEHPLSVSPQERPPSVLSHEHPLSVSSQERLAFPIGSTPAITSNRRPWSMISGPNLAGVVLLAIYQILVGIIVIFDLRLGAAWILLSILALVAGILILIARFVPAPPVTSEYRRWFIISGPSLAGILLLEIYLILVGIIGLFGVSLGAASILLPLLRLIAGILILIGSFVPASAIPSNHRRWFMISAGSRAGVVLLAIYLILVGIIGIFGVSLGAAGMLLPILALVAGILILIGK